MLELLASVYVCELAVLTSPVAVH